MAKKNNTADMHYLELLAKEFPNVRKASTEIVNLNAILSLPKGTEYFLSDLHGEHEAFIHMVQSASGVIHAKIEEIFGKTLSETERRSLASLVYDARAEMARRKETETDFDEWCRISIYRLIEVCKSVSTKYTRSKVRKRMPKTSEYIMDELLNADDEANRSHYYREIINSLSRCRIAEEFIAEMTQTISRLAVDRLHIIGDVFDRGAHPDLIMDYLVKFHDVDFQWGNHDIVWMGAAAGNSACIANVIRMNISYNNFDMLEIGYGINLRPLSAFALSVYGDDPCGPFRPHILDENEYDPVEPALAAKMHKAISVIQFKLEGQCIKSHPEYGMEDRLLLDKTDAAAGTVCVGDHVYPMRDAFLPTVDPASPYELTAPEKELMNTLEASFLKSDKLQRHIRFLFSHGAMYKIVNGNLLYHGCIPMTESGGFEECVFDGQSLSGRAYMDYLDARVRRSFFTRDDGGDIMWYLWNGSKSPLFGKARMTTFERLFVEDKATHKESSSPYYKLTNDRAVCEKILREFGLSPESSHILNGHVPVKIKDGESPIKGDGLLFFIDGGISKAYQKQTGIAGYTFIFNSRFMALSEHKPYSPLSEDGTQVFDSPVIRTVEHLKRRMTVKDTDIGSDLEQKISELEALVEAFREGAIKEKY
ncbi:MAG: fructose-1,6-bisphosphatase [Clostridiales Family XIII bacterium]|jgi:fructose-1,6-bisphosphatase-3|nr:fructose-1,6-bisphosphatase [Clostridiales Family XIII bacterium]